MATIVQPVKPPRTDDPIELERWYRIVAERLGYLTYAGDPTGVVTPRWVGDLAFDTANSDWYASTGLTSADWKAMT